MKVLSIYTPRWYHEKGQRYSLGDNTPSWRTKFWLEMPRVIIRDTAGERNGKRKWSDLYIEENYGRRNDFLVHINQSRVYIEQIKLDARDTILSSKQRIYLGCFWARDILNRVTASRGRRAEKTGFANPCIFILTTIYMNRWTKGLALRPRLLQLRINPTGNNGT